MRTSAPAPERGANAREMLDRTLRAQGARVVANRTVVVPRGDPVEPGGALADEIADVLAGLLSVPAAPAP